MRFRKKLMACLTVAMLVLVAVAAVALAESPDWGNGVIRVTGSGVGKAAYKKKSPGQYRLTAIQAARMDAQRKLLEAVEGVQVTAESSMRDLALESDQVKTRSAGLVKNAVEVGEARFNSAEGIAEVTMELKLYGGNNSVAAVAFLPYRDEPRVDFPPPVDMNIINQPSISGKHYTGLIIKCLGKGIDSVMSPVIRNAKNQKIYGHENLDYDKIVVKGMASYAESENDAVAIARAGNNPLIINAVSLADLNTTPVVSMEDADKILAANRNDKFLEECAVVFVK